MTNEGKKLAGPEIDENEIQELGPENLQNVNGGSFMGSAWEDIKHGAEAVGSGLETVGDMMRGEGYTDVPVGECEAAAWAYGEASKAVTSVVGDVDDAAKDVLKKL